MREQLNMKEILKSKIIGAIAKLEEENELMLLGVSPEVISERLLTPILPLLDLKEDAEDSNGNSLTVKLSYDELWYLVRSASALLQHIPSSSLPTYTGFDKNQIEIFSSKIRTLITDAFDE